MVRFEEDRLSEIEGERTVVTSALPYIHGVPHLGNIVGSLLPADLYHRYLDLRGHENIFICGSDEHGTPLELSALEAGEEPKEHADRQHEEVGSVLHDFELDFSLYGRTHTEYNEERTLDIFKHLYRDGYITEKEQELPYCTNCQRFLPDRYIEGECPDCGGLARGDQCDDCGTLMEPEEILEPYCTICGESAIEFRTTENLFLQLGKFEEELKQWLEGEQPVPDNQLEEITNLIGEELEDRCITRDIDWGFPVPWRELEGLDDTYEDKVLYVWFDAPIGYLGITQQYFNAKGEEERWKDYWKDSAARTIYSIGKDNTIFHSIIFPSMLIGGSGEEEYNLPDYEFIHQYLLSDEVQFSKSRGNGLSSAEALELLPADYWRFYLSSVIPENHDTSFSWKDFESKINGELNDNVGNFVNRVLTLTEKWFGNEVPEPETLEDFMDVKERLEQLVLEYDEAFEQEKSPKKALQKALEIARLGDEFLQNEEPWNDEGNREEVLYRSLEIVEAIAITFYPFTPSASENIWEMLGREELVDGRDRLKRFIDRETVLTAGDELGEREILFEKVEAEELSEAVEDVVDEGDDTMSEISFDEFQEMDLRTATITEVKEHPNADKLYLLQIDVGEDIKQSVAGLVEHYEPGELEGKNVVVVNNLETSELRGEKSECMVLAADDGEDVVLLEPSTAIGDGAEVR
ncbi:MAG: methionine--tRNA ligase [Candidatus Nanohaloarchaeota archaeon QJJ-7]|nr:methionine--tRNA ligase [Candidatus Nanohaloarchaeota archaeon QJJ-7]